MWQADLCLIAGALLLIFGVLWLVGLGWAAIAAGLILMAVGRLAYLGGATRQRRGD